MVCVWHSHEHHTLSEMRPLIFDFILQTSTIDLLVCTSVWACVCACVYVCVVCLCVCGFNPLPAQDSQSAQWSVLLVSESKPYPFVNFVMVPDKKIAKQIFVSYILTPTHVQKHTLTQAHTTVISFPHIKVVIKVLIKRYHVGTL